MLAPPSQGSHPPQATLASQRGKQRLDTLLFQSGLARSRSHAQALILSQTVLVNGEKVDKSGRAFPPEVEITLLSPPAPYVGRGGIKLEAALLGFAIDVQGKVGLDVGASTGGFTDCLLQHGAARVYAVDVGYGQMAWKLRQDPRVILLERQNVRLLTSDHIPDPIDIATLDLSFISLDKVIPHCLPFLKKEGEMVALIKPQFEVGKGAVGQGGIVRDPEQHKAVLMKIEQVTRELGLRIINTLLSPILGQKGNKEYLAHIRRMS